MDSIFSKLLFPLFLTLASSLCSGQDLMVSEGHTGEIKSLDFSPDGKRIYSCGNNEVKVWELATRRVIISFPSWRSARLSPDGNQLATIENGHILIRNTKTWEVQLRFLAGEDPSKLLFSPDGRSLVVLCDMNKLFVYQTDSGKKITEMNKHEHLINELDCSSNGELVISADFNRVAIWKIKTGEVVYERIRDRADYQTVQFIGKDDHFITSAGARQTVLICNIATGIPANVYTTEGWLEIGHCSANFPSGDSVVIGYLDRTVRLWKLDSKKPEQTLLYAQGEISAITVSKDGRKVAAADIKSNDIQIYEIASGKTINLGGGGNGVGLPKPSLDGNWIYQSGFTTPYILVWDVKKGLPFEPLTVDGNARKLLFSKDGKHFLAQSDNHKIQIGETKTWKIQKTWDAPGEMMGVVGTTNQIGIQLNDDTLQMWDFFGKNTGKFIKFPKWNAGPCCVSISPFNGTISRWCFDYDTRKKHRPSKIEFYNAPTYDHLKDKEMFYTEPQPLQFSPFDNSNFYSNKDTLFVNHENRDVNKIIVKNTFYSGLGESSEGGKFYSSLETDSLRIFDFQTLKPLLVYNLPFNETMTGFLKKGKVVLTIAGDLQMKLRSADNGKEILRFWQFENGKGWAVATPEGQFDCNEVGMKYLYYSDGQKTLSLSSRDRNHVPDLWQKLTKDWWK